MMKVERLVGPGLRIDRFHAESGQAWGLIGGNGSGIEQFSDVIAGETTDFSADVLRLPANLGLLSFKRQQSIFEAEQIGRAHV